MSATPGKVCVDGVAEVAGEKVLPCISFRRVTLSSWASRSSPGFDPRAVWLSDLVPAFAARFPFEPDPRSCPGGGIRRFPCR